MALVAGVDSSTTATKVEVRDLDTGQVVGRGSAPHPPTQPPRSEQDPAAWWTAFETAWQQAGQPPVAAISVAGQQHGMVTLDERHDVIRPAKLWNDTESAPDATWLIGQLPGGRRGWAEACGLVPVASFTITKLSWLHRREPEAWQRLASVLLPHDWLTLQHDRPDGHRPRRCLGHRLLVRRNRGLPPRPAGDRRRRSRLAGDGTGGARTDRLSPVSGEGRSSRRARATTWPGRSESGSAPGDVVISIGTSGTVYSVSDEPTADPSGTVAGFADATGRHLPLVCTLNATKVTEAVRRLLDVDHDDVRRAGAGGRDRAPAA